MATKSKKSAQEAIDAGPDLSNTYSINKPIGVPEGYKAPENKTPPTFFEGDDWKPARQSPEAIASVQEKLVDAGLLRKRYAIGLWDDATRQAYRSVLRWANASGVKDDAEALTYLVDTHAAHGDVEKATTTAELPPIKITNPDDLKEVFRNAAKRVLGSRNIDDTDLDRLVTSYQAQEATAGQAYQAAGPGVPVEAAPDPSVFAEQQVRELDPIKADARSAVKVARTISGLLSGGSVANDQTGGLG